MYDDENTKDINVTERNNHCYMSQVVLLLYAEQSYYDNESVDCYGAV
jgi:hypothetical protein